VGIGHWDDVPRELNEAGPLGGYWRGLGEAAGSVTIGAQRVEVLPGRRSTPLHMELWEEEIFYVLGGSGLSWQRDGERDEVFELGEGDCLVHLAYGPAHTLIAGDDGIDVLAFGMRAYATGTYLPRAGVVRMPPAWFEARPGDHPWAREAAAPEPDLPSPSARPDRIVNIADVEPHPWRSQSPGGSVSCERRDLGRRVGSERTGLKHVTVAPGKLSAAPHCHSAEEELFVVLDGQGMLELTPAPDAGTHGHEPQTHPLRRGHVVARPAGTKIAHAFRAGDGGLTLLAYGTREPNDIAYYPRSGKLFFRGPGVIVRAEHVDYWDGED
jgi:uncharacterized cupin superfamily protein